MSMNLPERRSRLSAAKLALFEKGLRGELVDDCDSQVISRRPSGVPAPLSLAQRRLWFVQQLDLNSSAYNIDKVVHIAGELNLIALEQSLGEITRRHEALRTSFRVENDRPVQIICSNRPIILPIVDLSELTNLERDIKVRQLADAGTMRPFDLKQSPLLRIGLLQLGEKEYVLLLSMHHIVCDGWSFGLLSQELTALYHTFSAGLSSPLRELSIQYADFAYWQQEWLLSEAYKAQLAYWKERLSGRPRFQQLVVRKRRSEMRDPCDAQCSVDLGLDLTRALKDLSQRHGVSLFMTVLGAFQTLLHRYNGQTDIIVGADVAGRRHIETEDMIGFFVNILLLRIALSGDQGFLELLEKVRQVVLEAQANQDVPFEKIVEELRPDRSINRVPLVQVLLVFQNVPAPVLKLRDLSLNSRGIENRAFRFDLVLFVDETPRGLIMHWRYDPDLFEADAIVWMAARFKTLLGSIVTQPEARLSELEMSSAEGRRDDASEEQELKAAKFNKFMGIKPRAVNLSQAGLVKMECLESGSALPLVIQPAVEDLDLIEWVRRPHLWRNELLKHGAILFRGFQIVEIEQFKQFAQAVCPQLFGDYGDLPREEVSGLIYSSTPYPSNMSIFFHNESSHMHCWPLKQLFFCVQAAQQGGETPLVDSRAIFRRLAPDIRQRFIEKKLMYVRNFIEGLDVSWQEFFGATDRAVVENYCRRTGIECEWKKGGMLRTRQVRAAVRRHPITNETVFFNQVQLHHLSMLDQRVRDSLLTMFSMEEAPRNAYYGDGTPIEDEVIKQIAALYLEEAATFTWRKGDVLLLDNMLTAHGRNPYRGPRKIVVAMGEMISDDELSSESGEANADR